jgi:predicted aspartyl protease
MADGSSHSDRRIMVNSISVNGHTLSNIEAGVVAPGQDAGQMLIGIAVLQRFGKISIDAIAHQLTLG